MPRKAGRAAEAAALHPPTLFQRLTGRRGLVLAVSGGPDSTALMLLMAEWPQRPPVLVVSVDHALRPQSAAEAKTVAANAERLGLPSRVMTVAEPHVGGNLQDWARRARYRCLAGAAREAGFDTIVTAHHREDQAETFLLRLARGSGVYGLAAMAEAGSADGIALERPLLGVSREALHAVAAASGFTIAADPGNDDPRFDRVRTRTLLPQLAVHGLTPERLAETAGRLGRAAGALEHYAHALLREHFTADPYGVVHGPADAFAGVPDETGLRALALILKAVGGADYTPRLDSLEAVHVAIRAASRDEALKRTLHGVVIAVRRGDFLARREWGRNGLAEIAAPAGATLLWDARFRVDAPRLKGSLAVGPLGRSDRRLKAPGTDQASLKTLPGLFQDGTLVAVPRSVFPTDDGAPLAVLAAECLVGRELGLSGLPK